MGGFKSDTPLFQKRIGQGCVCAITIFEWLQNCILHTYTNENYQPKVKGHEVRKSSASYIWTMGSQLKDVIKSMCLVKAIYLYITLSGWHAQTMEWKI